MHHNFTVFIAVVQLSPQHEVASRTHRSTNYQLNIYYVLIDYRLLIRQWYIQCIHYDYNKFNY